eukprot:755060-Hanusia_phi.AAC.1
MHPQPPSPPPAPASPAPTLSCIPHLPSFVRLNPPPHPSPPPPPLLFSALLSPALDYNYQSASAAHIVANVRA